jgi:sRNA-binding regulator protein Hfq
MTPTKPQNKPATTGHDSVIKAIQAQGRTLTILKTSGEERTGLIVGRDKYTITLKGSDGIRRVIYKHAIEEFWAVEA